MGTKAIAETIQDAKAKKERVTFARVDRVLDMPDLLNVQIEAYNDFLQSDVDPQDRTPIGLEQAFQANFPILDAREIFTLEYLDYRIERPKYTVDECRDRELTYAASLKARLRLSSKADEESDDYIETIELLRTTRFGKCGKQIRRFRASGQQRLSAR